MSLCAQHWQGGSTIGPSQIHISLDGDGAVVAVAYLEAGQGTSVCTSVSLPPNLATGDGFEVLLLKHLMKALVSAFVWKRYPEQILHMWAGSAISAKVQRRSGTCPARDFVVFRQGANEQGDGCLQARNQLHVPG